MKSVLISIRPQWCEKIASGEKTIEIRKTKPKLETPFKCYIYCCHGKYPAEELITLYDGRTGVWGGGKVVGEFVCDNVLDVSISISNPKIIKKACNLPGTGLTDLEIMSYLGNGCYGYGWHISDLKIYDTPKELSDFKPMKRKCCYSDLGLAKPDCEKCHDCNIKRPPQSWCYVEDAK